MYFFGLWPLFQPDSFEGFRISDQADGLDLNRDVALAFKGNYSTVYTVERFQAPVGIVTPISYLMQVNNCIRCLMVMLVAMSNIAEKRKYLSSDGVLPMFCRKLRSICGAPIRFVYNNIQDTISVEAEPALERTILGTYG